MFEALTVIPAKAGIQYFLGGMDSRLRGNDSFNYQNGYSKLKNFIISAFSASRRSNSPISWIKKTGCFIFARYVNRSNANLHSC